MRHLFLALTLLCLFAAPAAFCADEVYRDGPTVSNGGGDSLDPRDTEESICVSRGNGVTQRAVDAGSQTIPSSESITACPSAQQL